MLNSSLTQGSVHTLRVQFPKRLIVDWIEFDATQWSCSWNSDKNYTKLCQGHFYVCLNWALCSYLKSKLFQIYRSSSLPPFHASICVSDVYVVKLSRIWNHSIVTNYRGFWPFDKQVADFSCVIYFVVLIIFFASETFKCSNCALLLASAQITLCEQALIPGLQYCMQILTHST